MWSTIVFSFLLVLSSTLIYNFVRCEDAQSMDSILSQIKSAMINKQKSGTEVQPAPLEVKVGSEIPRIQLPSNSFDHMSKPFTRDTNDDAIWKELAALRKRIDAVEDNADTQQDQIDVVKSDIDHIDTELSAVKTQADRLDNENNQHANRIDTLDNRANGFDAKFTKIGEAAIGFTAYDTTSTIIRTYKAKDVIQFEATHYNTGNRFNPSNGKFTCPYHGLYNFGVTISHFPFGFGSVVFSVDGTYLDPFVVDFMITVNDDEQMIYETTSATLVVECRAGQSVWIAANSMIMIQNHDHAYSTFSGTLINRLDL